MDVTAKWAPEHPLGERPLKWGLWRTRGNGTIWAVDHLCFRLGPLAEGALNRKCGHVYALGVRLSWNKDFPFGWADRYWLRLWGLVGLSVWDDRVGTLRRDGPQLRVHWPRVSVRVRPPRGY